MPPEVPYCRPLLTPVVHLSSSPASPVSHKYCREGKRMRFSGKKLIPLLVFILTTLSILRLLRLAMTTSTSPSSSSLSSTLHSTCSSPSPSCSQVRSYSPGTGTSGHKASARETVLTEKEFKLLSDLITRKAPCNLLIFGLEPQYLKLSKVNARGITIFLEDDANKISAIGKKFNGTQKIYKVEYQSAAKDAYKLLKHARRSPKCTPKSVLEASKCKLALKHLPEEVYEHKWDVILVDGPSGDTTKAPGRMGAIYSAGMLARAGNTTDVLVHDVDRTIEKWFSWEFLCEGNLVSSKGKLWNFRITDQSNSTRFCSANPIQME